MPNWNLNDEYKIRLNLSPLALNTRFIIPTY